MFDIMMDRVIRQETYALRYVLGIAKQPTLWWMTKVSDERERMEDLAILFVERVARIHAFRCKTLGDLHVFTATILGTG